MNIILSITKFIKFKPIIKFKKFERHNWSFPDERRSQRSSDNSVVVLPEMHPCNVSKEADLTTTNNQKKSGEHPVGAELHVWYYGMRRILRRGQWHQMGARGFWRRCRIRYMVKSTDGRRLLKSNVGLTNARVGWILLRRYSFAYWSISEHALRICIIMAT